jgi:AraC-like DNA-binding protein
MFEKIDKETYQLLRAATIPHDIHSNKEYQYLPESTLKNLMEVLGDHLDNDRLGWLFLRSCKEVYVPRFLATLTKSTTLKEALDEFCAQLMSQSSGARLKVEQSGGSWWLVRHKSGLDEQWFVYAEMFSVICIAEMLRALTQDEWLPLRIGIQSQSIDDFRKLPSLEMAQFFIERPVTAVEIPEELLFSSVQIPSKHLSNSILDPTVDIRSMGFIEQFRLAITPYLSMGKLPIVIAAEILRMNVRTLQRKLSRENVVYQELIESMVFEQVTKRIINTDDAITLIASRFGYSDAAHFTRSFKRIYGCTPTQYRKKH